MKAEKPANTPFILRRVRKGIIYSAVTLYLAICGWMPSALAAMAQQASINSSPNPVGSGARALGMGGAFIAIADDATAASWNPAGLIQLETPEISVVGSYLYNHETYSSASYPDAGGPQSNRSEEINYLSLATPFQLLGQNAVASLNYQTLYDLNRRFNYGFNDVGFDPPPIGPLFWNIRRQYQFQQQGALHALSPALAVQVTPAFSVGLTLNWWTDQLGHANGWHSDMIAKSSGTLSDGVITIPTFSSFMQRESYDQLDGANFHIGALWEANEMFRFGAVVKTPFNLKMRHHYGSYSNNDGFISVQNFAEDVHLHFPISYGLGMALKFSDAFTLALDVSHTNWKIFYFQVPGQDPLSPLDGRPLNQSRVRDTHSIRLGGEYLLFLPETIIPLRAGLYSDPQPSPQGFDRVYGVSLGTGYTYNKKLVFDIAYTYDWGNGLNGAGSGIPDSTYNLRRQRVYASCIVHF